MLLAIVVGTCLVLGAGWAYLRPRPPSAPAKRKRPTPPPLAATAPLEVALPPEAPDTTQGNLG